MPTATVTFHEVVQDAQNYASFDPKDDYMVAVIKFTLKVSGRTYDGMSVEVRQPYGTDYATEPLEVGQPIGPYNGNWNHNAFADLCEGYYRGFLGSSAGSAFRLEGVQGVRMRDVRRIKDTTVSFHI